MGKGSNRRAGANDAAYAENWPLGERKANGGTYAMCDLCGTVHRKWEEPKPEHYPGAVFYPVVFENERRQYCTPNRSEE